MYDLPPNTLIAEMILAVAVGGFGLAAVALAALF
jgi:hypothetical protein